VKRNNKHLIIFFICIYIFVLFSIYTVAKMLNLLEIMVIKCSFEKYILNLRLYPHSVEVNGTKTLWLEHSSKYLLLFSAEQRTS